MDLFNDVLGLLQFVEGLNIRAYDLPRGLHHYPLTLVVFAFALGT